MDKNVCLYVAQNYRGQHENRQINHLLYARKKVGTEEKNSLKKRDDYDGGGVIHASAGIWPACFISINLRPAAS